MSSYFNRIAIVEAYNRLHRECHIKEYDGGLPWQTSTRRNILKRSDGRPCLIDFSRAATPGIHMQCHAREYWWFNCQLIYAPEFTCLELDWLIRRTEVFEKGEMNIQSIL